MPRGQSRISVSIGATQITETRLIFSPIIQHIVRRVDDTPISEDPFAHLYVEDVFPADVYDQILENLPGIDTYVEFAKTDHVSDGYNRNRMYLSSAQKDLERIPLNLQAYWRELFGVLNSEELLHVLLDKFMAHVKARFEDPALQFARGDFDIGMRLSLVRDLTGFELGPHTDGLKKILSGLFYVAADDTNLDLGTSLYVPKNPNFVCVGGPHHPFNGFRRVKTMPYKPNSFFIFPKTRNCFHGLEQVPETPISRDILFLDIIGLPAT